MLVVRIELWPFGSEKHKREIARMRLYNDGGGTHTHGNYVGETWFGDSTAELDASEAIKKVSARNVVKDWPRKLHVWNLVQQMLTNMDYGFNGLEGWK